MGGWLLWKEKVAVPRASISHFESLNFMFHYFHLIITQAWVCASVPTSGRWATIRTPLLPLYVFRSGRSTQRSSVCCLPKPPSLALPRLHRPVHRLTVSLPAWNLPWVLGREVIGRWPQAPGADSEQMTRGGGLLV